MKIINKWLFSIEELWINHLQDKGKNNIKRYKKNNKIVYILINNIKWIDWKEYIVIDINWKNFWKQIWLKNIKEKKEIIKKISKRYCILEIVNINIKKWFSKLKQEILNKTEYKEEIWYKVYFPKKKIILFLEDFFLLYNIKINNLDKISKKDFINFLEIKKIIKRIMKSNNMPYDINTLVLLLNTLFSSNKYIFNKDFIIKD